MPRTHLPLGCVDPAKEITGSECEVLSLKGKLEHLVLLIISDGYSTCLHLASRTWHLDRSTCLSRPKWIVPSEKLVKAVAAVYHLVGFGRQGGTVPRRTPDAKP